MYYVVGYGECSKQRWPRGSVDDWSVGNNYVPGSLLDGELSCG